MSINEHIKEISEASKNGKLNIFVGAGVSKLSNYPDWKELTDEFARQIGIEPKQSYSNEEYLSIPQKYYYSIEKNNEVYYKLIKEQLDRDIEPNIVHNLILNLKPVNIITTNFDNLIEKAVSKNGLFYDVISNDLDVANAKVSKYILKVHGDLSRENIVLKEEDYLNYAEDFKLVDTLLKSIFSTNTVVFIGYSLGDYNIKLILNWVRNLQGEGFKNPYFIYVNESEITDLDRTYYKSRGLEILDYKEFLEPQIDYLDRYKIILEKIIFFKENELLSSSGQIDYLYSILKDLNKLAVLRREDIYGKIKDEYIIDESGFIRKYKTNSDYIEKFNALHKSLTSEQDTKEIPIEIKNKYDVIKEVFTKGQVNGYIDSETLYYGFISKPNNLETVYLDYGAMEDYIKEEYDTLVQDFKKAYFLFKLGEFKRAFSLYSDLARKYFNNKDYLMYYFAQINRYNSYNAIQSLGSYSGSVVGKLTGYAGEKESLSEEDMLFMKDFNIDEIFDSLPLYFKKTYSSLKDLYNQKGLYKNIYKINKASEKVRQNINNKSTEFGFPSIGKVIGILNPNLNFVYGNYLIVDEYDEFKALVKESLKSILLTYSDSSINYITYDELQRYRQENLGIQLDSYDFSCLIQYFSTKELKGMFKDFGVKWLEFIDFEICFNIVENIISYFDSKKYQFTSMYLYKKISGYVNNVVEILKYAHLSIEQYRYIVNNIFKIDNNTLNIGNKIMFLDKQHLLNPNIKGIENCRILESVFERYLNKLTNSIDQNTNYDEHSVNSLFHIDIVNYIVANDNEFKSDIITKQVEKMIESKSLKNYGMLIDITPVLYQETVDKLLRIVKDKMDLSFDFGLFEKLIVNNHERECQKYEDALIEYLKIELNEMQKIEMTNKETNDETDLNKLSELPKKENRINKILESVGYWSLMDILNRDKYIEFKSINKLFDFFIDIDSFNFDSFDESWIIKFTKRAHENISRNEKAKKYIKNKIKNYLNDSNFDLQQKERLLKLYLDVYNSED